MSLKILYSLINKFPGESFEDFKIAENIAKHGIYAEFLVVGPTAYKLPVYPLFLSFFVWAFPNFPKEAAVIAQHIIFFLIPLLIISITKIFTRGKSGILAAYFFIFSPAYFFYSNIIEVTNIFVPVFLIWIYVFLVIYKQEIQGNFQYFALGIMTALLFLTQVVVVPFACIMMAGLFLIKKIKPYRFSILLGTVLLFYSPWVIRNAVVFDKLILTKTPFWQNIYFGLTPPANVDNDINLVSDWHEQYTSGLRRHVSEFDMERIYRKEVLRVLAGNEEKFVKKAIQNAVLLWYVPSRYFYDSSPNILFGRKIFVIILNIFTIIALLHFFKNRRLLFVVSVLLFINFTVPYMIGHAANTRFKLDFEWYQYLIVAAFFTDRFYKSNPEKFAAQSLKN